MNYWIWLRERIDTEVADWTRRRLQKVLTLLIAFTCLTLVARVDRLGWAVRYALLTWVCGVLILYLRKVWILKERRNRWEVKRKRSLLS